MSKIIRTDAGKVLSQAVEYHNFVFLAGMTADDTKQDVAGQTRQILAKIDAALETHGTDKTRLLQERRLVGLAAGGRCTGARLRRGQHGRSPAAGGDHGDRLQIGGTRWKPPGASRCGFITRP